MFLSDWNADNYTEVSETECIQVYIPAGAQYRRVLAALLSLPSRAENYIGDDESKKEALAQQWFNAYVQTDWGNCAMSAVPVGTIIASVSPTPDDGWLLCDGSQYARADYPALAALIPEGTLNIGGNAEFFNVPAMTGRGIIGVGASVSWSPGRLLGQTGGAHEHQLTVDEMPEHTHQSAAAGTGTYNIFSAASPYQGNTTPAAGWETFPRGGNDPHNNMPPFFAAYYHIYAGL